jgi:hypothetical protein
MSKIEKQMIRAVPQSISIISGNRQGSARCAEKRVNLSTRSPCPPEACRLLAPFSYPLFTLDRGCGLPMGLPMRPRPRSAPKSYSSAGVPCMRAMYPTRGMRPHPRSHAALRLAAGATRSPVSSSVAAAAWVAGRPLDELALRRLTSLRARLGSESMISSRACFCISRMISSRRSSCRCGAVSPPAPPSVAPAAACGSAAAAAALRCARAGASPPKPSPTELSSPGASAGCASAACAACAPAAPSAAAACPASAAACTSGAAAASASASKAAGCASKAGRCFLRHA